MNSTADYYELLGVEPDAGADEIRRAYRREINLHHPDKPGGDEERARLLEQARSVLLDPAQRRSYDRGRVKDEAIDHAVGMLTDLGERALEQVGVELQDRGRGLLRSVGAGLAGALRRRRGQS